MKWFQLVSFGILSLSSSISQAQIETANSCIPASQFQMAPHAPRPTAIPNTGLPRRIYEGPTPHNYDPNRPVILFVQGLHGSARDWWSATVYHGDNDMLDSAYAAGYKTFFVDLWDAIGGGSANSFDNGCLLKQQIDFITDYWGVAQLNIIAHSKGGLDSNYALLLGASSKVNAIVTLSSPHWGSALADLAGSSWLTGIDNVMQFNDAGTQFLQTANMAAIRRFLDQIPLCQSTRFFTFAAKSWGPQFSGLWFAGFLLSVTSNDNDGLVSINGAKHPLSRGDNGDLLGQHRVVWNSLDHDSIRIAHPFQDNTGNTSDCYWPVFERATQYIGQLWPNGNLPHFPLIPGNNPAGPLPGSNILRSGTISPNGHTEESFPLEPGISRLHVSSISSSEELHWSLRSPYGAEFFSTRPVDAEHPIFQEGAMRVANASNPAEGNWTVLLHGPANTAYTMIVSVEGGITLPMSFSPRVEDERNPRISFGPVNAVETAEAFEHLDFDYEEPIGEGSHSVTLTAKGKTKDGFDFERSYVTSVMLGAPSFPRTCAQIASTNPKAPKEFSASQALPGMVRLSWQPPKKGGPVGGYEIYRSQNSQGNFGAPIARLDAYATSYNDATAFPGITYYYAGKSVGPGGTSALSRIDSGSAMAAPNAPSNLQASDFTFPNKIRITWTAPVGGGQFTSYKLYRSNNTNPCSQIFIIGLPANLTQWDDTGLAQDQSYCYSIKAIGPGGESACSNVNCGYTSQ